ncbi:MAG: aspartate aminotransferase [Ignavibacteriales bacterium CG_4_9_14_3_um_filter_30_11]|nr:MAG: aspartate aminotransferase [Ignavibacteriales bacterium CG_4_9_14_3_um_filter_30_11]
MARKNSPDINLNLNVRGLYQSATLYINEKCNELESNGKLVYKFGLGQSPFPVPQSVVEELKANAYQKNYLPSKGLKILREAVAEYHCIHNGICYTSDDVIIGPGSKELMFLLQYVYYGDILIQKPSWVSYSPQAHIIGRQVRWICTTRNNNWLFTAEELEALCNNDYLKPRIVILNYPSNPIGVTYTKDQLKKIAAVARRHKLILLSDEIYGELHHKGEHISIAKYYGEGTIISSGLSKWCGAGGWRLGTFTFPESLRWLLEAISVMASETFTSTSAPIQYAAVRAFKGGSDIENYLWRARWILSKLGNTIAKNLQVANIVTPNPDGAFYLFLDFNNFKNKLQEKNIFNSTDLCSSIHDETGVAILPGEAFGMKPGDLTARLAYVDFDGVAAMKAASKLNMKEQIDDSFLKKYCSNVLNGVKLLTDWINN